MPGQRARRRDAHPHYGSSYVFDDDFAALTPDLIAEEDDRTGPLVAQSERGLCRVVCFSPRHDLTLGQMSVGAIRTVVDTWVDQSRCPGAGLARVPRRGSHPVAGLVLWPPRRPASSAAEVSTGRPHSECMLRLGT